MAGRVMSHEEITEVLKGAEPGDKIDFIYFTGVASYEEKGTIKDIERPSNDGSLIKIVFRKSLYPLRLCQATSCYEKTGWYWGKCRVTSAVLIKQ